MSEQYMDDVEKLVEDAKAPGTFNILNVLKERAYPSEEVSVYLDEDSAFKASQLKERIKELEVSSPDSEKISSLNVELNAAIAKMEESKYTFKITGISEGARNAIQEKALEKHPLKYEDVKNAYSGEVTKKEIEDKSRDRYFTDLLWSESIKEIHNVSGDVQTQISMEEVSSLRELLPIAAIGAVTQSIEKLRMATALFMISVDEDFLAKS